MQSIAAGLAFIGVQPGDTMALMLTNRPEFHLVDAAAMHLGAIPFSVYNTFAVEQLVYVFENAKNRVLVTERQFLDRARLAAVKAGVTRIVCVDVDAPIVVTSLHDLELAADANFDFDAAWRAVRPDNLATLIYTSGTTGPPKGVELTHANLIAQLEGLSAARPIGPGDSTVSYLPAAHIADRVACHYSGMYFGMTVTSVSDSRDVANALIDARPTLWMGFPRVWEKLKGGIVTGLVATAGANARQAVLGALDVGLHKVRIEQAALRGLSTMPDDALLARYRLADETVFGRIRASIGLDRLRWGTVAGAPIARNVLEFFAALGLPIIETWGMSETSCVATFNPPDRNRIGSVGVPLPGVRVRLAEDGEMLVRGATVMKGYRSRPEQTAETIDAEGWLKTGDIGTMDEAGYLSVVDRKKELIVNTAGHNMSPAKIEGTIKSASILIGQAVSIGDGRPFNVALLILDPETAAVWAIRRGLSNTPLAELTRHPELRAELDAVVERANQQLSRGEQIKRYALLPSSWEPGGDELTPTLKLKRKFIVQKYAAEIDSLYAPRTST